jgi:ribose 1,5-bisphosphokinase
MLVLVVGPSGAGKDTLLDAARTALAGDPRFRFARRVITRPAEAGGEAHEAATEAEFAARTFALAWGAHGLRYGIPADIADDLAVGRTVVANVSSGAIAEAARRFPVRVIEVTAPPEVLAARLAARGREVGTDIAARLARSIAIPDEIQIETVINDSALEVGAARFLAALLRAMTGGRSSASQRNPLGDSEGFARG